MVRRPPEDKGAKAIVTQEDRTNVMRDAFERNPEAKNRILWEQSPWPDGSTGPREVTPERDEDGEFIVRLEQQMYRIENLPAGYAGEPLRLNLERNPVRTKWLRVMVVPPELPQAPEAPTTGEPPTEPNGPSVLEKEAVLIKQKNASLEEIISTSDPSLEAPIRAYAESVFALFRAKTAGVEKPEKEQTELAAASDRLRAVTQTLRDSDVSPMIIQRRARDEALSRVRDEALAKITYDASNRRWEHLEDARSSLERLFTNYYERWDKERITGYIGDLLKATRQDRLEEVISAELEKISLDPKTNRWQNLEEVRATLTALLREQHPNLLDADLDARVENIIDKTLRVRIEAMSARQRRKFKTGVQRADVPARPAPTPEPKPTEPTRSEPTPPAPAEPPMPEPTPEDLLTELDAREDQLRNAGGLTLAERVRRLAEVTRDRKKILALQTGEHPQELPKGNGVRALTREERERLEEEERARRAQTRAERLREQIFNKLLEQFTAELAKPEFATIYSEDTRKAMARDLVKTNTELALEELKKAGK